MAASSCVHNGRTEITNDEPPRSPDKKRDQEKSEPKRDATPYTWHRPEAAKREDRKEQGGGSTQRSQKHFIPPTYVRRPTAARAGDIGGEGSRRKPALYLLSTFNMLSLRLLVGFPTTGD